MGADQIPEPSVTVGIDGENVGDWGNRRANFEVIVGKSVPEEDRSAVPDLWWGMTRNVLDLFTSAGCENCFKAGHPQEPGGWQDF
ncbi:hypothetical protein FY036_08270 [Mesorhizobium microcysteis]|uniref:Uncharacterized protein n=1 Tax=Neoaquamicrobium microcysteis TaxID=2682781 RepID=A0A5D4GZS8_9HYPH|nr:hypothetical protein [Mesorhizobium microcysteis]TYR33552.1 hypothetical protein FY036_08270 [Mesorhizobium microcysteis]